MAEKKFDSIQDYSLKVMLFNLYLSELFKLDKASDHSLFTSKLAAFKSLIHSHLSMHVSPSNNILENEFVSECFAEILDLCNTLQAEAKPSLDIAKLKALTYEKILTNKFRKRLDQRTAQNELGFVKNLELARRLVRENAESISQIRYVDKLYR